MKKIKLIKKKRLKKKPSLAGSEGAEDSTTAEGGMDGESDWLEYTEGEINSIRISIQFSIREMAR